jgi:hypothetical protein
MPHWPSPCVISHELRIRWDFDRILWPKEAQLSRSAFTGCAMNFHPASLIYLSVAQNRMLNVPHIRFEHVRVCIPLQRHKIEIVLRLTSPSSSQFGS